MGVERNFKDTITYWAKTGYDTYGKSIFAAPVTFAGRWEDKQELFRDKKGDEITSKSRIFCKQDLGIDGWLFKGTSVAADPTAVESAWEIRALGTMPDLRSTTQLTVAIL